MPDKGDELIKQSLAIRAQAETLIAWSKAVRETSIAIREERVHPRRPFALPPRKPRDDELIALYFSDQRSGSAESTPSTPDTASGRTASISTR